MSDPYGSARKYRGNEQHVDASQFFRISRAAIVRLDAVFEIAALVGGYGEVQLRSGTRLPVSRRRYRDLLTRVGGPIEHAVS